jgi:hypothetical protein
MHNLPPQSSYKGCARIRSSLWSNQGFAWKVGIARALDDRKSSRKLHLNSGKRVYEQIFGWQGLLRNLVCRSLIVMPFSELPWAYHSNHSSTLMSFLHVSHRLHFTAPCRDPHRNAHFSSACFRTQVLDPQMSGFPMLIPTIGIPNIFCYPCMFCIVDLDCTRCNSHMSNSLCIPREQQIVCIYYGEESSYLHDCIKNIHQQLINCLYWGHATKCGFVIEAIKSKGNIFPLRAFSAMLP